MPYAVIGRVILCWRCHRNRSAPTESASALDAHGGPERRAYDLRRPAGWKRDYGCHTCGATSTRYLYGRCGPCVIGAIFDHFTPDSEAATKLDPLREALLIGPRPWTVVDWLKNNPELLIGMGTGTIPIDHAALDALPTSRTTETIRGRLVATGCLPKRNNYAAAFENWLPPFLAKVEPAPHRLVLQEYSMWRLLPRMRQPKDSRPQTYSTFQLAKSRVRAALRFLDWLTTDELTLPNASQVHVDEFLATNPQLIPTLEPFILWASQSRRSPKLECKYNRNRLPKSVMNTEQRWALLGRFLQDETLDLADRTMGALVLTYALPLTTVLSIRAEDLTIDNSNPEQMNITLRVRSGELQIAPGLDRLLAKQLSNNVPRIGPAIVTGTWLFPGAKAGEPLSQARAAKRLRELGLHPGPGRYRALLHLAARVEAPLLAQALGISAATAVRWAELAGRPYSGYVSAISR